MNPHTTDQYDHRQQAAEHLTDAAAAWRDSDGDPQAWDRLERAVDDFTHARATHTGDASAVAEHCRYKTLIDQVLARHACNEHGVCAECSGHDGKECNRECCAVPWPCQTAVDAGVPDTRPTHDND